MASGVALGAQAPPRGSGSQQIQGPIRIIDGDTLEVFINGRQTAVGLIGIQAPWGNTPCGQTALIFLRSLIRSNLVTLEEDLDITFDARNRRMYYLKLPGNVSATLQLALAGLVRYTGEGKEAGVLLTAILDAITNNRGCAR
jgi:endonuclease YncB( thermonuclease family)